VKPPCDVPPLGFLPWRWPPGRRGSHRRTASWSGVRPKIGSTLQRQWRWNLDRFPYITYASSLQQGDLAPAGSANTGLAPYRSIQWEVGVKVALSELDLPVFRLDGPVANVDPVDDTLMISSDQLNCGVDMTAAGEIARNLTTYGGVTLLDPKPKPLCVRASRLLNSGVVSKIDA
jgi:hypothetical protein